MNEPEKFQKDVKANIKGLSKDKDLQALSRIWVREISPHHYAYNFTWMGRPAIQFPQDMLAVQEIVWNCKPDLIIETGIAHGGSLVYSASLLELIGGDGLAIGIDVEIRPHNRKAIEEHPMFKRIKLIEGSSTDPQIVNQVSEIASKRSSIMVILDSNHTHQHVLKELSSYSPLVTKNNYLIVFDTLVDDMPERLIAENRPWGESNNPKTAVKEWIKDNKDFEIDKDIDSKLLISAGPDGYLKRVK